MICTSKLTHISVTWFCSIIPLCHCFPECDMCTASGAGMDKGYTAEEKLLEIAP
jgi:hypothetical protein